MGWLQLRVLSLFMMNIYSENSIGIKETWWSKMHLELKDLFLHFCYMCGTSNLILLSICFVSKESGNFYRKLYHPCLSQGTFIKLKWFQWFQSFTTKLCCPEYLELFLKFTFGNKSHDNIDLFYLCSQLIKKREMRAFMNFEEVTWHSHCPLNSLACLDNPCFLLIA